MVYRTFHNEPTTLPQRPQRHRIATPGTLAAAAQTLRTPHQIPPPKIFNAILYILRTGAAWQMLPHNCRPTASCFHRYSASQQFNDALCQQIRRRQGAIPSPAPPSWTAR